MAYNDIISKLKSDGAIFRCQGILECLTTRENSGEVPDLLQKLKSDSVIILGRKVGSFARAALDVLGIERYEGAEEEITKLITDMRKMLPSA